MSDKLFRLPVQVLVYCYRRRGKDVEYLMLRRSPKYSAFWQGVTGAPEGAETLLAAAARELFEETQIVSATLHQVDFHYTFPVQDQWKWAYHPDTVRIDEYVFLAEVAFGTHPILSSEHDEFCWASFERAMTRLTWPNNRDALEFCGRLVNPSDSALEDSAGKTC